MKTDFVDEKKITGLMFAYYYLCARKLWFYSHGIGMEQNSEEVQIGNLLDENSYKKEEKHILDLFGKLYYENKRKCGNLIIGDNNDICINDINRNSCRFSSCIYYKQIDRL